MSYSVSLADATDELTIADVDVDISEVSLGPDGTIATYLWSLEDVSYLFTARIGPTVNRGDIEMMIEATVSG